MEEPFHALPFRRNPDKRPMQKRQNDVQNSFKDVNVDIQKKCEDCSNLTFKTLGKSVKFVYNCQQTNPFDFHDVTFLPNLLI